MQDALKIGQLAAVLGVDPKTIRYYEELGMIRPARAANGYRLFSAGDVARLRFVRRAKRFGLTLSEVKMLLESMGTEGCSGVRSAVRRLVEEKLERIRERMQELSDLKADLEGFLQGNRTPPFTMSVEAEGCVCLEGELPHAAPNVESAEEEQPAPCPGDDAT
jgi:DNA-binding transcriptional MerR regulator